jgi:phage baseplate assembly protein W
VDDETTMGLDSNKRFLGTGWAFPPAFDGRTLHALTVSQDQDVRESLRILLSTVPGERVMHPTYGCGLQRMVFENITESTLTEIRSLVEKAVLFFEVRITLDQVEIDTADLYEGVLKLQLNYTIRSTNVRDNLVYPLYLNDGAAREGLS